jgi:hypothetical protein
VSHTKPCPCPNLNCPNNGVCEDCTSRHLKIGTLNYCGFYSILPKLEEAVDRAPDSATALALSELLQRQKMAYTTLMDKHDLSEDGQIELRNGAADFSEH